VAEGRFRQELFYRLNVIPVTLPPLRDRREDIPLLVEHFLDQLTVQLQKRMDGVSVEAMAALVSWPWPGNVRELRNVLERGAVVAKGSTIQLADLGLDPPPPRDSVALGTPGPGGTLEDVERRYIAQVLEEAGGNVSQAARILDIDRVTLYAKIKKFGLHKAGDEPAGR